MKKKIINILICSLLAIGCVGCGGSSSSSVESSVSSSSSSSASSSSTESSSNSSASANKDKKEENKVLKAGEEATIKTDSGSYKFKVNSIQYKAKDEEYTEDRYIVTYEYENIDFVLNGLTNSLQIPSTDIKVTDGNGYVLKKSYGVHADEIQDEKAIAKGEKCIVKVGFTVQTEKTNIAKVSFSRLDDMNMHYEIEVK